jgi:hypothetical protein
MRPLCLAAAYLTLAASAWAQPASIQSQPLPPLQQQWQQQGAPPVPQAPAPPTLQQRPPAIQPQPFQPPQSQLQPPEGQPPQGQFPQYPAAPPPAAATPPVTFDRPNIWLPATAVKLQALDKVNAQSTALTIKVGQSATFGSLTITVKACVTRPADQPADAAAYLDVTDSHPDLPPFDGWMLEDEPSVSMLQHPIYDLRVTGCA